MARTDDEPVTEHGPLRRNAPLLAGVLAVVIIGPFITRMLETDRAIVLEVRDGQMFLGREAKLPTWVDATDAQPGDIISKEAMEWGSKVVEPTALDHALVALHERYSRVYKGKVLRIDNGRPGGPRVALLALADGTKINLPVYEHLANLAVGNTLEKHANSWDPVISDDAVAVEPTPSPAPAPPSNSAPSGAGAAPGSDQGAGAAAHGE